MQSCSPLARQRFAEYKDRDFLEAVDRGVLADELSKWWPLVHVYFTGDKTQIETTAAEFDAQRQADAERMELSTAAIDSAIATYLPARADAYTKLRGLVA